MTIQSIIAKEVKDSNNKPTIEVTLTTTKGKFYGSVPSGTSTGKYEAHELRDKDGGVYRAVQNINKKIAPKLIGKPLNQHQIDNLLIKLDGTKNKSKLGANATLAVSMAVCRAGASEFKIPLYKYLQKLSGNEQLKFPTPMMLLIEGGKHHIGSSAKSTDIQEFMIMPKGNSFQDSYNKGKKVYKTLGRILTRNKHKTNLGMEGAYLPDLHSNERAFVLIDQAIKESGFSRNEIPIAIDAAASEFYKHGNYYLEVENKNFTKTQLVNYYSNLASRFNITSIEDPFGEDDWKSWQYITKKSTGINIVGDDLLVTNKQRIRQAIKKKASNTLLLKINQIGTISEALSAYNISKKAGMDVIVSHRSGETNDSFIADLSLAISSKYIKAGSPSKPERLAKYNRLIKIEKELNKDVLPISLKPMPPKKKIDRKFRNLILNGIGLFFLIVAISAILNTSYEGDYEGLLWLCYSSLFILSIGVLMRRNILVLSQLSILTIPLIFWGIDFLSFFVFGNTLFGMTDYMFTSGIVVGKLIGLQHLFTIPLALIAMYFIRFERTGNKKIRKAWKISLIQIIILFIISRLISSPEGNINCVYQPCINFSLSNGLNIFLWFYFFAAMILATHMILVNFYDPRVPKKIQ